jgi:hypothetical protein
MTTFPTSLPTLPKLPTLASMGKPAKLPKLKKPRLSIADLNAMGAEAVKGHLSEVMDPEDTRPALVKALDVIDVPRNLVANAIGALTGVPTDKLERGTFGLPKVYGSDILKHAGVENSVAAAILGFGTDVALDPLTYLTGGAMAGKKIAQYLPKLKGEAASALKAAGKTGRVSAELAEATGFRTARLAKAMRGRATRRAELKPIQAFAKATGKDLTQIPSTVIRALRKTKGQGDIGAMVDAAEASAKASGRAVPSVEQWSRKAFMPRQRVVQEALVSRATGGSIGQVGRAVKPATQKAALRFIEQGAQKGRPLLGIPGTGIAGLELKVGGQARKFRAVTEALKDTAKLKAFSETMKASQAGLRKAIPLIAAAKSATAEKAAKVAERKGLLAEGKAAVEKAGTVSKSQARKIKTGIYGGKLADIKAQSKALVEQIKTTGQAKAAGVSESDRLNELRKVAITSPDAPAVIKEMMRAEYGPTFVKGDAGLVSKLYQLKRQLFGPGRGPVHQALVGIEARRTGGAAYIGARETAKMAERLKPIIKRLALTPAIQAEFKDEAGISKALRYLVEAGPNGEWLGDKGKFGETDALRQLFKRADRSGLLADQEVKQALADLGGGQAYLPRQLTPEAAKSVSLQDARWPKPDKARTEKLNRLSPEIPRSQRLILEKEGEAARKEMLSTSTDQLRAAEADGWKVKKREWISAAEMDAMAERGDLARMFHPGTTPDIGKVIKEFKGPVFQDNAAAAYGAKMAFKHQADALQDLRRIAMDIGTRIPATEGADKFGHLSSLDYTKWSPDNPMRNLIPADLRLPVPVVDMLNEMAQTWDRTPAMGLLISAADGILSVWKTLTLWHPSYVTRNVFQNLFGTMMAGGNVARSAHLAFVSDVGLLRNAVREANPSLIAGRMMQLGQQQVPMETLYRTAVENHIIGAGQTANIMTPSLVTRTDTREAAAKTLGAGKSFKTAVFRGNQWFEDRMRLGTWLSFVERGMDPRSAAIRTLVAMPDMSDLTRFERETARRFFPWYSWMRRNGSLQIMHFLPRKPAFAAMIGKAKNFMEGLRGEPSVPEELRPEWMREAAAMQVSGNKAGGTAIVPRYWLPFDELYNAVAGTMAPGQAIRAGYEALHPGLRMASELATGFNMFRGQAYPRGNQITTPELMKAFPQALFGKSGTQLDTLFSVRPLRELVRTAEMPTVAGKLLRPLLGGSIQPLSAARGYAEQYGRLTDMIRKTRNALNRAKQVGDEGLARNLTVDWLRLQKRLMQLGLPGVNKQTASILRGAGVQQGEPAFATR